MCFGIKRGTAKPTDFMCYEHEENKSSRRLFMTMDDFKEFLIRTGYSERTPAGNPSTVYDYQKRVQTICEKEHIPDLDSLAARIDEIERKYAENGEESAFGAKSHNAYINAIRRFQELCQEQ